MEEAFLSRFFLIWQPQPISESGILSNFCLYDSPACKVCFAGRISHNNLYTGRISLYKRIRRGCCSGYFNRIIIQKYTGTTQPTNNIHRQSVSQSVSHSQVTVIFVSESCCWSTLHLETPVNILNHNITIDISSLF